MSRRRSRFDRLVDGLFTRRRKLPPATSDYSVERGLRVPMRDGVELVADLYTPSGVSRGLILVRSAYGRRFPFSTEFARPYAERGFSVLMQSTRGTFGSGGDKVPFHREIEDGADTVAWMRDQAWFPGRFAMLGASYLGYNAWAVLMDPPPELATAILTFAPHHFGRILNESGAMTLDTALKFSESFGRQEKDSFLKSIRRGLTAERRHAKVITSLPVAGAETELLAGRSPWYREWLAHPDSDDEYFRDGDFDAALRRAQIPLLIEGGWQDVFLESAFEEYEALRTRGVPAAVTIGPWTHADIAGSASSTLGVEALAWLGEQLAGDSSAVSRLDTPLRLFVTGAGEWRDLVTWPPPAVDSTFRLGVGGTLGGELSTGSTGFTYDPADPTPSVGGASQTSDAGSRDNAALEARDDVLTFTGDVLAHDVEVIGTPRVRLFHDSDNPHADLLVRLCDVDERGRSFNLSERYLRLDGARSSGELDVDLRPLAHRFMAGHRLRVQIAGGAFPRYIRNMGTDAPPGEGTELAPSHRTVWHDDTRPSSITLPIGRAADTER